MALYTSMLLLAACFALISSSVHTAGATKTTATLTGQVFAPSIATTIVLLYTSTGEQRKAYLESDGTFTFDNVPRGTHLLQPFHMSVYFPEVLVEVGEHGPYRAHLLARGPQQNTIVQALQIPLKLRPVSDMQYYEKRKPVDVWGFIKSPYGLMVVFSLFVIVVMPRLKVDPDELRQFQSQIQGQPSQGRVTAGSNRS